MKPFWLVVAVAAGALLVARRRRLEPTLLAGGALFALGAFGYGLGLFAPPNLEVLLEDLGSTLGAWTYLLVGALAFLETGAFVGLIAPGETAILVGGVVAGQGEIDIVALIALVWAAAVAGDVTSFLLGRRLGRSFLERHGRRVSITPERLEKTEAFFDRHGGKAILLGRFVGLIRAIAPFLAGSSGMPLRRFLPYDVIGAGLWGTTFCLLGYLFWQSFGTVLDYAKTGALALGTTIAVVTAVVVVVRFLRVPEHRARVRRRIDELAERPALRPFAALLRPVVRASRAPARFLADRVTPGQLGLELTTLLAIAGVGAFVVLGYAISLDGAETTPGDDRTLALMADLRAQGLVDVAEVVTDLGLLAVTTGLVVVALAALALRREVLEAWAIGTGWLLTLGVLELVRGAEDRPRPLGGLVETTTSSFPSAHTAHAVAWVAVAVAVARVLPGWGARLGVVLVAVAIVVAVALTRLYLGVHHLSDVLAGAGLALACFAACGAVALLVGHVRHAVRAP